MRERTAVWRRRGAKPPVWLLAVVLGALTLGCQSGARLYPTQASLDAQLAELRPRVEQLMGVTLPSELRVELAPRHNARLEVPLIRQAVARQLGPVVERLNGAAAAEAYVGYVADELQGTYDPMDQVILVYSRFGRYTPELLRAWQRAVLVHELMHVAFDQQLGLIEFLGEAHSLDELWLRRALIEGHARWQARQLAESLDASGDLFDTGMLSCDARSYGPGTPLMLRRHWIELARRTGFARDGEALMTSLAARDPAAPRRLLADPPDDVGLLYHQSSELARRGVSHVLQRALAEGLEPSLGARPWTGRQLTVLPTFLHQLLRMEGPLAVAEDDDLDVFLRQIQAVAARGWGSEDQTQALNVIACQLSDDAAAERLVALFEEAGRADTRRMQEAGVLAADTVFTQVDVGPITGYRSLTLLAGQGGAVVPYSTAVLRQGEHLLRFQAKGYGLSLDDLVSHARDVFSRVEAAAQTGPAL